MLARSSTIHISYQGTDITQDISPMLTSFTFTDNSHDKADDISITLADRNGLWLYDWTPAKSDSITCSIQNSQGSLPCGTFSIDQIDYSLPPSSISIKAISTSCSNSIREEKHTRAWEAVTLAQIAGQIANDNGLSLFLGDLSTPFFHRVDQVELSDIDFIKQLGADNSINVKVRDNQLILFDSQRIFHSDPVATISLKSDQILTAKFSSKAANIFSKCKVRAFNPISGEVVESEALDESVEGVEHCLNIHQIHYDKHSASLQAKSKLLQANSQEVKATISMIGNIYLLAGVNIRLSDCGMFSGQYLISKATHSVNPAYTTTLELVQGEVHKAANKSFKKQRKSPATPAKELFYEGTKFYGYKEANS